MRSLKTIPQCPHSRGSLSTELVLERLSAEGECVVEAESSSAPFPLLLLTVDDGREVIVVETWASCAQSTGSGFCD